MKLKAIIFDVDGTLADTELAHLKAFNLCFAEFALPWQWDENLYRKLLLISGGKERMEYYCRSVSPEVAGITIEQLIKILPQLHSRKNAIYSQIVAEGGCPFRPGVKNLIENTVANGLNVAIATTTSTENVIALLDANLGNDWKKIFQIIEDASTAKSKKPHPLVYQQCLARLNLAAEQCLAIEDSNNGMQAAVNAGIPVLITENQWTKGQDFQHALVVLDDLAATSFETILSWYETKQF